VLEAKRNRVDVKVVPDLYDGIGWCAPLEHIGEFPVLALNTELIPAFSLFIKRALDVLASSTALMLFSPLLIAVAILIKLESAGPVLYVSERVGKKGRTFRFYKFRTMVADAPSRKAEIMALNERNGPFFKVRNDPRLTRLGRVLRKYSVDELPQLWNVLKGEMSLVGPRPHPLDDFAQYRIEHFARLKVRPGMTGLWQVTARQHPSFEAALNLDEEYIRAWSPWLDLKLLLKTIPAIVRGTGC
jgi:exopolysaccharide biosynthesis polyprenyl glycosylphosphotransferase